MKWITAARGVRYYEHKTRKHGIMPDRNYVVYFRRDGKPVYEKIGWASEGWTLEKALNELHQLKAIIRAMLWNPNRLLHALYELRNQGLISKISEIDNIRQFTTKYSLAGVVEQIVSGCKKT